MDGEMGCNSALSRVPSAHHSTTRGRESGLSHPRLERIDLPLDRLPARWYNVLPDLPRAPAEFVDAATGDPVDEKYLSRLLPAALVAQDRSLERWISIPDEVLDGYRMWRPTPLFRAHALE